jgi:hypothetical protein
MRQEDGEALRCLGERVAFLVPHLADDQVGPLCEIGQGPLRGQVRLDGDDEDPLKDSLAVRRRQRGHLLIVGDGGGGHPLR